MDGWNAGGIQGLLDLLDHPEHGEALEYDLIALGLRLRDFPSVRCTWRDLLVIVRHSEPRSAYLQAVMTEKDKAFLAWDVSVEMQARVVDALNFLAWTKTEDAEKGRNRPEPTKRPWDEPDEDTQWKLDKFGGHLMGDVLPAGEMIDFLGGPFSELSVPS